MQKIRQFLNTHKHAYAALIFIPLYTNYFVLSHLREPVWVVHSPVDDIIPFTPPFIIFYCLWFFYISLPLIFLIVKSGPDFLRAVMFLSIGMVICHLVYLFFPNEITFRAAAEEEIAGQSGFFAGLVKFIYMTDLPRNVFPSTHCYESIVIHITLCHSETGRKYKWMYPISLFISVMICLSTMFIKQHSFYDVISGVALAFVILPIVYIPKWKFLQKKDEPELPTEEPAR